MSGQYVQINSISTYQKIFAKWDLIKWIHFQKYQNTKCKKQILCCGNCLVSWLWLLIHEPTRVIKLNRTSYTNVSVSETGESWRSILGYEGQYSGCDVPWFGKTLTLGWTGQSIRISFCYVLQVNLQWSQKKFQLKQI